MAVDFVDDAHCALSTTATLGMWNSRICGNEHGGLVTREFHAPTYLSAAKMCARVVLAEPVHSKSCENFGNGASDGHVTFLPVVGT